MQMDAVWAQVIGLLVTVAFSAAFEPAMGLLGKKLGRSKEEIKEWPLKEGLENPLNTAVQGGANVATTVAPQPMRSFALLRSPEVSHKPTTRVNFGNRARSSLHR